MASISMMLGGAVINAAAFTGGNYLAKYLSGDSGALAEKTRHDKALEAYEAAQARYSQERTKLLDWIKTKRENKALAKQNFTNTDYAFKLYNQAHPDRKMTLPKEPKFSNFYQPSKAQKQGEHLFVAAARSRSATWRFVFFEPLLRLNNGCQARQKLLQPPGVLERHRRHQKISRSRTRY